jgi:hypothetical protein
MWYQALKLRKPAAFSRGMGHRLRRNAAEQKTPPGAWESAGSIANRPTGQGSPGDRLFPILHRIADFQRTLPRSVRAAKANDKRTRSASQPRGHRPARSSLQSASGDKASARARIVIDGAGQLLPTTQGTNVASASRQGITPAAQTHFGAAEGRAAAKPHQRAPTKLKRSAAYANASASAENRYSGEPAAISTTAAA